MPTDYTLTLRIVLRGIDPPVERTLSIGVHHTLGALHRAIQLAFDGSPSAHHAFCDQDPFPNGFPATAAEERCAWFDRSETWRPRRRWGDDWTKIDLHDPTVIDEAGHSLREVFWGSPRLHYRSGDPFDPGEYAWFCIDQVDDDIVFSDPESVLVVSGRHRSPLSLLAVRQYAEQLRVYANPGHPDHREVNAELNRAAGPWGEFDPAAFDAESLQVLFDHKWGRHTPERARAHFALDAVADQLPAPTAAGLRRHIVQTGLHLPALVTPGDAARFVSPFTWLLAHCRDGIPLDGDELPESVADDWLDDTGITREHIPGLLRTTRDLRLVRRLKGRLILYKAAVPLADDPHALWAHLAETVLTNGGYSVPIASALFALAIVDGSVSEGGHDGGLGRIARALDLRDHITPHSRYGADPAWYDRTGRWELPPTTIDQVRRDIQPLAERLAPLGLAATSEDTWTASPELRALVHEALSTPAPRPAEPSWALREVF